MDDRKLGAVEARFADLIWANEPLSSRELVELCARELEWKKSTTYTVLKRLCEKGLFQNEGGVVSSRMTKEEFHAVQSERFVEDVFSGSLPAFFAAFTKRRKISEDDLAKIKSLIQEIGED